METHQCQYDTIRATAQQGEKVARRVEVVGGGSVRDYHMKSHPQKHTEEETAEVFFCGLRGRHMLNHILLRMKM